MEEHNKNTSSSNITKSTDDYIVINFVKFLGRLWKIRMHMFKMALLGAVLGVAFAFSIPKTYEVSVVLSPEMVGVKGGGGFASMAASLLGGGMSDGGPDALHVLLAPQIVHSTPFLLELLDTDLDNPVDKTRVKVSDYLEKEATPWWKWVLSAPRMAVEGVKALFASKGEKNEGIEQNGGFILTKEELNKIKYLRSSLSATVEKKTSIITLSTSFQDPMVTALLADSVVSKLQKYIVNYKISKASKDCQYWENVFEESRAKYYEAQKKYADYVDAHNNVIYHSTMVERERLQNEMSLAYQVYGQVAQQLEMARAKIQESRPVFTVVEPATVPIHPINTSKMILMVAFAFLAVILTVVWEFWGHKLKSYLKHNLSEIIEESKES